MLAPDSRALLLDALRPPPGYSLDSAVATTFTLDLTTTLMVPLAFAGFRFEAQPDPIEVMESLREMSGRLDVFCQAGAISAARWPSDLVALLEDVIHGTKRPRPGHVFHPKVWALRFLSESREPSYRLLVLSRNLTADRSWDTILWLDGRAGRRPIASNAPLARFIAALPSLAVTPLQRDRKAALDALAAELRRVEWELPDGVREMSFHPVGLPGSRAFAVREHFSGYRRLVISPFVRAGSLQRLFEAVPDGAAVLVSRGEELDALPSGALDGIEVYELDPMASLSADEAEETASHAFLTHLHAKLFVVERARLAHLFVGSANATEAGFGSNVEFLCELVGSPSALGVAALVGEGAPFQTMLMPYTAPEEPIIDEAAEAGRALEELLFDIAAQVSFRMAAVKQPDGWAARVRTDALLPQVTEGTRVTLAPHNRPAEASPLTPGEPVDLELPPREAADLTPFLQLKASRMVEGQLLERSAVVCAQLVGGPEDRFQEILARQINTPEKFLRLLALLLGMGTASGGALAATGGAVAPWSAGAGMGVLELLARALSERPESLDHLASIVERLRQSPSGRTVLPPGWDDVWIPALEARRAMAEAEL